MEVMALIGPSGTGKSYRSMTVARDNDIECIIDDGLLIYGNKVVAGSSAKREQTKIAAIRRAIFNDANHREAVKKAIGENNVEKILILGTSDNMVNQIAKVLDLPTISKRVYIREVSTLSDIKTALKSRRYQGKHVIPVPTFEIKKDFSGYFLDPLKVFRIKGMAREEAEKSIVRPTFSYFGKYFISNSVLESLVTIAARKVKDVHRVNLCDVVNIGGSLTINMAVTLVYGNNFQEAGQQIQRQIKEEVEYMTGFHITDINITIKGLIVL
jgi:uncharacterized alkaline shock family protein YloU